MRVSGLGPRALGRWGSVKPRLGAGILELDLACGNCSYLKDRIVSLLLHGVAHVSSFSVCQSRQGFDRRLPPL